MTACVIAAAVSSGCGGSGSGGSAEAYRPLTGRELVWVEAFMSDMRRLSGMWRHEGPATAWKSLVGCSHLRSVRPPSERLTRAARLGVRACRVAHGKAAAEPNLGRRSAVAERGRGRRVIEIADNAVRQVVRLFFDAKPLGRSSTRGATALDPRLSRAASRLAGRDVEATIRRARSMSTSSSVSSSYGTPGGNSSSACGSSATSPCR